MDLLYSKLESGDGPAFASTSASFRAAPATSNLRLSRSSFIAFEGLISARMLSQDARTVNLGQELGGAITNSGGRYRRRHSVS